jgi:hypothetical protein
MKNEELLRLLLNMGSQGRAEFEDPEHLRRSFYAVPEQMRSLDPDVTLILGSRGAGKTSLFRAISEFGLTSHLKAQFPKANIPANARWIPLLLADSTDIPPREHLTEFFEDGELPDSDAFAFWEGTLIRSLWEHLRPEDHASCSAVRDASGSAVEGIVSASKSCKLVTSEALDRLDDRLIRDGHIFFVGYDDLDLLVKWTGKGISSLMGYWAVRSRRWKGIRTKLFMRTDLYNRFGVGGGPDLAKIAANRITLSWTDQSLLGMLVRRMLNAGNIELIREALQLTPSDLSGDDTFGWGLKNEKPEELGRIITALLGQYMGAGPKKGATQRWIINHIKDCQDNAVPRFLVRLIESAAEKQLESRNEYPTILSPLFIREALSKISGEHVVASSDEWPWLPDFKNMIQRSPKIQSIPFEKKVFETEMGKRWKDLWANAHVAPCDDYRDFLRLLEECGIMRIRHDGRYETTDLYLDGLGFRRKGGVKKRQR